MSKRLKYLGVLEGQNSKEKSKIRLRPYFREDGLFEIMAENEHERVCP